MCLEPDYVRHSSRPGDILAPHGHKPSLAGACPLVDLEIVDVAGKRRPIIADREEVIVLIVRESQNEPAIIR